MNIHSLHSTVLLATITLSILILTHPSTGLITPKTRTLAYTLRPTPTTTTRLHSSYAESNHLNNQRLCFRNFLTQRSIQSFLSLTAWQLRDPHTSEWVERFVGFPGLLEFHGIGGFDVEEWGEWDKVFLELMKAPEEKIVLQVMRQGGRRAKGGSKGNPFLKEEFVEYDISIDPKSLSTRILAVREQIADELAEDLNLIVFHNKGILDAFHNNQERIHPNCLLDSNIALATSLSSPLRKGSFDLLQLLSLQESIHRTLRSYSSEAKGEGGSPSADKEVSFEWLREFYFREVNEFFDGTGELGRADDFIDELLNQGPRVVTLDGGADSSGEKTTGLLDPSRITEDILEERSRVSMEWKEVAACVREEHSGLRKALLMRTWDVEEEKEEEVVDAEGGFE